MKRTRIIIGLLVGISLYLAAPAAADENDLYWDPGEDCMYCQLPDLSPSGVDINCTSDLVLPYVSSGYAVGDDFILDEGGKITDIHLWASWKDDILPNMNPTGEPIYNASYVAFNLSICTDDPVGPNGYSQPSQCVWTTVVNLWDLYGQSVTGACRLYEDQLQEGFMNPVPPYNYVFPGDTKCYQYDFYIPPEDAFTASADTVYWLVVQAEPLDHLADFGWKTSGAHWNDYAVGMMAPMPGTWTLINRSEHTYDMAFVITPEPASLGLLTLGAFAVFRRRK